MLSLFLVALRLLILFSYRSFSHTHSNFSSCSLAFNAFQTVTQQKSQFSLYLDYHRYSITYAPTHMYSLTYAPIHTYVYKHSFLWPTISRGKALHLSNFPLPVWVCVCESVSGGIRAYVLLVCLWVFIEAFFHSP